MTVKIAFSENFSTESIKKYKKSKTLTQINNILYPAGIK